MMFKGVTWLRDSHALFDYESTNVKKSAIQVTSHGTLSIDEEFDLHLNHQDFMVPSCDEDLIHIEKIRPGNLYFTYLYRYF